MPVPSPAFSFEHCRICGEPKTILEAMYLDYCEDCEVNTDLLARRPALYTLFGLDALLTSPSRPPRPLS